MYRLVDMANWPNKADHFIVAVLNDNDNLGLGQIASCQMVEQQRDKNNGLYSIYKNYHSFVHE